MQLVNEGPVSTFASRGIFLRLGKNNNCLRLLSRKFFLEGETEKDMICRYCPGNRVLRRQRAAPNSNLLRHAKSHHANDLKRVIEEMLEGEMVDARGREQLHMYLRMMKFS